MTHLLTDSEIVADYEQWVKTGTHFAVEEDRRIAKAQLRKTLSEIEAILTEDWQDEVSVGKLIEWIVEAKKELGE